VPEFRGKGKGKDIRCPTTGHGGAQREQSYSSTLSLISALDEGECSTPCPGRLILGRSGTHSSRSWVGPGPVWAAAEILIPTGTIPPDRPGCSESLYAIPVRPEFRGNPGNYALVADISLPETRRNFNGPNLASKEGGGPQPRF
jgi:hypothetical protein